MFRLLTLPIRLPLKTARLALRLSGFSNTVMLLLGVGIGLLIAPTTGAEMRRRLREQMQGGAGVDGSLDRSPSTA